jgi:hypothetical protein
MAWSWGLKYNSAAQALSNGTKPKTNINIKKLKNTHLKLET